MIVPRIIQAPVRSSAPLREDDGAALHLQAGEVSHRPADDDDPALHPHADFETGRAVDDDRAVRHPGAAAAVGRADLSAGVAARSG